MELSEEQSLLVATARRFVSAELLPLENKIESAGRIEPGDAKRIFEASKRLGLYALNVPAEFGGGGLSNMDWMLAEEQFGHATDILVRRAFGNVYDVLLAGTEDQKRRWLVPAAKGERTGSIAFTEPEAGSDAAGIKSRAERSKGGWVLSGRKQFVSDALHSDFFIVSAVTGADGGRSRISAFVVDKDTPGLTIGADQPMMGLRGTTHAPVFFNDVELGPENLIGKEGEGLKLALATLGRVRLAQVAARAVGKAVRILRLALDHARERRQFGRRIGDFQMIQAMLADSAVDIASARAAVWRAAGLLDRGSDARVEISMAKLLASEALGRVADRAVQILGGYGYAKPSAVERLYRDSRVFRIFDGTSEIHRSVIAKRLLDGDSGPYDVC